MSLRFVTYLLGFAGLASALSTPGWSETLPINVSLVRPVESHPSPQAGRTASLAAFLDGEMTSDDVRRLGREAYVWGWPLVFMHNCRRALERVSAPGRSGGTPVAPPNQLCMLTDYIAPSATAIACPNQDVIYGFGILDLDDEPVVLQVPDFGDRFWLFQLGDQRTDGFASVGQMYGTPPGFYLIVGPNWQGPTPEGFTGIFRCPTRLGFCLPRVHVADDPLDREAVLPVLRQIMMYPITRHRGKMQQYDWTKTRWYPRVGANSRDRSQFVSPEEFFDVLPDVLDAVPPLPGEAALYRKWRGLLAAAGASPRVKAILEQTAVEAERELMVPLFDFRNFGTRLANHWSTIENGAAFRDDYLTRAAVARSNIFVNRQHETRYFYQDLDAAGQRLDGRRRYRLTFAPEQLPAVKAFWSLTLYNAQHAFHANPLGRQSLGSKSEHLKFAPDGSLTIYVQSTPPEAEHQANWLPAPAGEFSLYLRAYWPEPAMLEGRWPLPAVIHADDS